MANADSSFIGRIALGQTQQLREVLRQERSGHGSSLVRCILVLLDDIDKAVTQVAEELNQEFSNPGIADAELRRLLRLLPILDALHTLVAKYRTEVGRQDLSVGLQYLVTEVIEDVLRTQTDPLLHLSPENMYSTWGLSPYLGQLSKAISGVVRPMDEPHPVVFNLPALAPENILYSPILVHEVGHTAARQFLLDELLSAWDGSRIDEVFRNHLELIPDHSVEEEQAWGSTLVDWCEETLCDALGLVLTGPSFLFSLAVFLPAPSLSEVGSHPHERDRIRHCLDLLEDLGWSPFLADHFSDVIEWATGIASLERESKSEKESFLREALQIALPAINQVARSYASQGLDPSVAEAVIGEALPLLRRGIPCVRIDNRTIGTWEATLCGWAAGWELHGKSVDALPAAVHDRSLNRLILKTIEYARIQEMWTA